MARVDITQADVLTRVMEHLRSELELHESHCYECDDTENPIIPRGGDYWVTVYAGPGQFDIEMQVGGGENQLMEQMQLVVTAYSRVRLGAADLGREQLHDAKRGLYVLKAKILKAMVGADVTDADGNTFLRSLIYALRAGQPLIQKEKGWGRVSVEFGVDWDWDLS